jgi:site-specific recombinase XerD
VNEIESPTGGADETNRSDDLDGLIQAWLGSLWARNRIGSARTETAYRLDLQRWAQACGSDDGRLRLAQLDPAVLEDALGRLARAGYAVSTRSRMLAALRGFCAWLVANGHLETDPTTGDGLRMRGEPSRMPVALSDDELGRLVATVATADPTARLALPARDLALVAVLAGCGLRASELCVLTNRDVLLDPDPLLVVQGKGRKQRRVPVPQPVLDAIDAWRAEREALAERSPAFKSAPAGPLFCNGRGSAFTASSLDYHVLKWFARAGIPKTPGEAAHALRHTYAKGLVATGAALPSVSALLGHADLRTTSIYLRMTAVDLAEAAAHAPMNQVLRGHADARRIPTNPDGSPMRNGSQ